MIINLILLFSINTLATPLKVAVLDTGLDLRYSKFTNLCKSEHKDFTGEGFNDTIGHGSNVIGLITENAQSINYCIVLIKVYSKDLKKSHITEGLEYAYDIKANIINLSGGGFGIINREKDIVEKILNANITFITAAGNQRSNLDKTCNYYPACYDKRIYVIGNYSISSNYGQIVDAVINGQNKTAFGINLSGTSQSAAIFTGKLIKTIAKIEEAL